MSAVNNVNFLIRAAALFPSNGHANLLLKSHYLTTSRELAARDLDLPKKEFGKTRICQKCSAVWLDGNLKLKIQSKNLKRPKQKGLITKLEAGESLTRRQKTKAKWLKNNSQSRVDITCLLCKHKTKIHLEKPKKESTSQSSAPSTTQDISELSSSARKPKKKRKDKCAGLNPTLVAHASTSSCTTNVVTTTTTRTIKHPISSASTSTSSPIQSCAKITSETSKAKKSKKKKSEYQILPQSNNIKKTKKKSKNQQNQPAKEVSKTQQKNTLLQLAQLLKSSASLSSKRPNPLENLLR